MGFNPGFASYDCLSGFATEIRHNEPIFLGIAADVTNDSSFAVQLAYDVKAGEVLLVCVLLSSTRAVSSVSDGVGSSFSFAQNQINSPTKLTIHYAIAAANISAGSNVTITLDGNDTKKKAAIYKLPKDSNRIDGFNATMDAVSPEPSAPLTIGVTGRQLDLLVGFFGVDVGSDVPSHYFTERAPWLSGGRSGGSTSYEMDAMSRIAAGGSEVVVADWTGTASFNAVWLVEQWRVGT